MHSLLSNLLYVIMLSCMLKNGKSFGFGRKHNLYGVLGTSRMILHQQSALASTGAGKYSKTVLLPVTTMDIRANASKREPEIQKFWQTKNIYEKLSSNNPGEKYVLHDGPPYANGDLHIGHALNKILKDLINKYQTLLGKKVSYVPGWDCHGLPIELKVLQNLKPAERQQLTPIQLRKTAADFAKKTMATQREGFKRYGVWGTWDKPYLTLQAGYEAAQIRVFGEMVEKGHIYRGKRPVNWSPSSRTALAEAELEYPENHSSRSVYVGFPTTQLSSQLLAKLSSEVSSENVRVAIWTTTPWTLPGNVAVAVNAALEYCVVGHSSIANGTKYIVAKDLMETFADKIGLDKTSALDVFATVLGSELIGTKYKLPVFDRVCELVIGGDYINTQSGTGLVHTAPGHGAEDYQTGLKYNLPQLSPVDDAGCFTAEAGANLEGLDVLGKGTAAVISALQESGVLIKEEPYKHKYPHDWRTKKPTICRMTEQWFASVSGFRTETLNAIDHVNWIPAAGRGRIVNMVESRADWCISRQRIWGVPIPVFYHVETKVPLMTKESISHVENIFKEKGSDAWWELETVDLLPPSLKDSAHLYVKGTDTMDVWFDSGTSWAGVVQGREELGSFPADMYLEGSDQHRGWFQSSLLTSVATQGVAPYKTVLTHGFVNDEKGMKMSKSIGNVVDPLTIIEGGSNKKETPAYGADVLRMWVSGTDYWSDVSIGPNIIKHVAESYRKLRNTMRFLLGSLNDFNPKTDLVAYDQLPSMDKNALGKLSAVIKDVEKSYYEYSFFKASRGLVDYAITELSTFYLVQAKDRLYVTEKNDIRRRACQTVLYHMLEQLTVAMAPMVPHLAEDVWQSVPYAKNVDSVFEKGWIKQHFPVHDDEQWKYLIKLRDDVNFCMERARRAGVIGASMDSRILLHSPDENVQKLLHQWKGDTTLKASAGSTNNVDDLRFLFVTSQVEVMNSEKEVLEVCSDFHILANTNESNVTIGVTTALGKKCERCWIYCQSVGEHTTYNDLCSRCAHVMIADKHSL